MPRPVATEVRFGARTRGEDTDFLERVIRSGGRIYSSDRFNFIQVRRSGGHTWDATDLELALEAVLEQGVDRVLVIGSSAGRLDHLLGGTLLLASPRFASMEIDAWLGAARVMPIHTARHLQGTPGSLVSLSAVHGPADGVRTDGLRWPLVGERLEPGSSRGLSNELVGTTATVQLSAGALLAVLPAPELAHLVPAHEGDRS